MDYKSTNSCCGKKRYGIKVANSLSEVKEVAESIIGMNLVTPNWAKGKKVLKFIEQESD